MNLILYLIGIPFGVITFRLGEKLAKKLSPKSDVVAALLYVTPLLVWCSTIITLDILF